MPQGLHFENPRNHPEKPLKAQLPPQNETVLEAGRNRVGSGLGAHPVGFYGVIVGVYIGHMYQVPCPVSC